MCVVEESEDRRKGDFFGAQFVVRVDVGSVNITAS